MKRILSSLLVLGLLFLPACRRKSYRNDLSAQVLAELGANAIAMEDPVFEGADALPSISESIDSESDVVVCHSADGSRLDEICVFHTDNNNAATVSTFLRNYLSETFENNRAYYDSYIPSETPKLRDAEVRIYGSYVVYAILDKNDRSRFFETIKAKLTET